MTLALMQNLGVVFALQIQRVGVALQRKSGLVGSCKGGRVRVGEIKLSGRNNIMQ